MGAKRQLSFRLASTGLTPNVVLLVEMTVKVDTAFAGVVERSSGSMTKKSRIVPSTSNKKLGGIVASRSNVLDPPLTRSEGLLLLDDLLSLPSILFKHFDRSVEIDEAALAGLVARFDDPGCFPKAHENQLIDRSIGYANKIWTRVNGTFSEPVSFFTATSMESSIGKKGNATQTSVVWGKSEGPVDASATRVLAYLLHYMSYERCAEHNKKNAGILRLALEIPGSRSMVQVAGTKMPVGVDNRVSAAWWAWRREPDEGDYICALAPYEQCPENDQTRAVGAELAKLKGFCRGSFHGFYRIKPLAPNVCKVTFVFRGDMGGQIPKFAEAFFTKRVLGIVTKIQDRYERNVREVDDELRRTFTLPPQFNELTSEQQAVVEECRSLEFGSGVAKWDPLPSPSPHVSLSMRLGDNGGVMGKAETVYVGRQICFADAAGSLHVCNAPRADIQVDYGERRTLVRASSTVFWRATPLPGDTQCKIVVMVCSDLKGWVPSFAAVREKLARMPLLKTARGREQFNRDAEVDGDERELLARRMSADLQGVPSFEPGEEELVARVRDVLDCDDDMEKLPSTDPYVDMDIIFPSAGHLPKAKAVATIDSTPELCAAYAALVKSRKWVADDANRGTLLRTMTSESDHASIHQSIHSKLLLGTSSREFVTRNVWRYESADVLEIAGEPYESADFPSRQGVVRGTTMHLFRFERLQNIGEVPQTLLTYIQSSDMKVGIQPKKLVRKIGVGQLEYNTSMRRCFDKSEAVDLAERRANETAVRKGGGEYAREERAIVQKGLMRFNRFEDLESSTAQDLKMGSPLTQAKISFQKGDTHAQGWATTIVRATPLEVLAYVWDPVKRSSKTVDNIESRVTRKNLHNQVWYVHRKSPAPLEDRDYLMNFVWATRGKDKLVVVTTAIEDEAQFPRKDGVIRAQFPSTLKITKINDNETRLEYVILPDAGGKVPIWLGRMIMGSAYLSFMTSIREFFQEQRGVAVWAEGDGEAVGEAMLIPEAGGKKPKKGENKEQARMRVLFKRHKGLREIQARWPWFEEMMSRVVRNTLKPPGAVDKRLCNLSAKDGRTIGSSLALCLATNTQSEAAVQEWIEKFPALQELDDGHVWFRPMVNTVAMRLLAGVPWGAKMRLAMGAGLSFMDMISDIWTISRYVQTAGRVQIGEVRGSS
ncbi:hypothetical protein TeGR_g12632 [Tetraparma gracilis]|uniref:START domain-containing protein n=1 Tax=Tetraparma gracilis TaxID=2962635 RepID=A0ABQ6MYV8_9STRA|nr:hypothetical protein TeGR_g12632 [Tetraparma gracilis]